MSSTTKNVFFEFLFVNFCSLRTIKNVKPSAADYKNVD